MPKERPKDPTEAEDAASELTATEIAEKRSYYYDDAHGYEEYDPKKDVEDKDEDFED